MMRPPPCICTPLFVRYGPHWHYPDWLLLLGNPRVFAMLDAWWPLSRRARARR